MSIQQLILAVPKGRILDEFRPLMARAGIEPEKDFDNPDSRKLRFATNVSGLELIRVRAFDVATFVAFGAASMGVCGQDVLNEFDYPDIYAPLDLRIGYCRMAVCRPVGMNLPSPRRLGHVRVATKYPETTRRHYAAQGVQAECVQLSGAMELAPLLGLSHYIVDLVASGATLRANNLEECETITEISSRLIVNRAAYKTRMESLRGWVDKFGRALDAVDME